MAEVNVLIIVDVENALLPGNQGGGLPNNVWMLDTGKYTGTREGGTELITNLNATDQVTWSVQAIDPGTNVAFATPAQGYPSPFIGTAVSAPAVINPQQNPVIPNQYMAVFSPPGGTPVNTEYQYSVVLSMDGQPATFDPFLNLFKGN